MIYSILSTVFLFTAISAIKAPAVVYSANIINQQNTPINCKIIWTKPSGQTLESHLFTIGENDKYDVKEHIVNMNTWEARAIIEEIQCADLSLKAPFAGVQSPKTNWPFIVTSTEIISGGDVQNY